MIEPKKNKNNLIPILNIPSHTPPKQYKSNSARSSSSSSFDHSSSPYIYSSLTDRPSFSPSSPSTSTSASTPTSFLTDRVSFSPDSSLTINSSNSLSASNPFANLPSHSDSNKITPSTLERDPFHLTSSTYLERDGDYNPLVDSKLDLIPSFNLPIQPLDPSTSIDLEELSQLNDLVPPSSSSPTTSTIAVSPNKVSLSNSNLSPSPRKLWIKNNSSTTISNSLSKIEENFVQTKETNVKSKEERSSLYLDQLKLIHSKLKKKKTLLKEEEKRLKDLEGGDPYLTSSRVLFGTNKNSFPLRKINFHKKIHKGPSFPYHTNREPSSSASLNPPILISSSSIFINPSQSTSSSLQEDSEISTKSKSRSAPSVLISPTRPDQSPSSQPIFTIHSIKNGRILNEYKPNPNSSTPSVSSSVSSSSALYSPNFYSKIGENAFDDEDDELSNAKDKRGSTFGRKENSYLLDQPSALTNFSSSLENFSLDGVSVSSIFSVKNEKNERIKKKRGKKQNSIHSLPSIYKYSHSDSNPTSSTFLTSSSTKFPMDYSQTRKIRFEKFHYRLQTNTIKNDLLENYSNLMKFRRNNRIKSIVMKLPSISSTVGTDPSSNLTYPATFTSSFQFSPPPHSASYSPSNSPSLSRCISPPLMISPDISPSQSPMITTRTKFSTE